MRRAFLFVGLLSIAACGTLAGHAVTYLLEGRTMDDGHHGYFSPSLEIALASALLCGMLMAARLTLSRRRAANPPALPVLSAVLATLQVAGFVALESWEGNAPDAIGCVVEALTALIVAVIVSLFVAFVERCVTTVAPTYRRRSLDAAPAIRRLSENLVRPSLLLAVCVGVRRFKRPPPIFG